MHSEKILIKDLFSRYQTCLNDSIQRPYEWDNDETIPFLKQNIIKNSNLVINNKNQSQFEPLENLGTFEAYKVIEKNNYILEIDNGGSREMKLAITILATNTVVNEKYSQDSDFSEIKNELNTIVQKIKKNFTPHSLDVDEFYKIVNCCLNNEKLNSKDFPKKSYIKASYDKSVSYFQELDRYGFKDACVFLLENAYIICNIYDKTTIEIRKIKYNELNGIYKQQNETHRMESSISEDGKHLKINDIDEKINTVKEIIENNFPQKTKEKKIHNPKEKEFLECQIFSEDGYVVNSETDNLEKLVSYIFGLPEEKRKEIYKNLFNETDAKLFCSLVNGNIYFKPKSNGKNDVYLNYGVKSLIFRFRQSGRGIPQGIFFRLIKDTMIYDPQKSTLELKPNLSERKVIKLFILIRLFKIFVIMKSNQRSDERNYLLESMKCGPHITCDTDLEYYINVFENAYIQSSQTYEYQITRFSHLTYNMKKKYDLKEILALIRAMPTNEKTIEDDFINIISEANNIMDNLSSYDIDHIVMKNTEKQDDLIKAKINSIGNLRLLEGYHNKSQNIIGDRFIESNSKSFPQNMTNKTFDISCIEERGQWIADVARKFYSILYESIKNY